MQNFDRDREANKIFLTVEISPSPRLLFGEGCHPLPPHPPAVGTALNPTPHFARGPCQTGIEGLVEGIEQADKSSYLGNCCSQIIGNQYQMRCTKRCLPKHHDASQLNETCIRKQILGCLDHGNNVNLSLVPDEQEKISVAENLKSCNESIFDIGRKTRPSSDCNVRYSERSKRLIVSNFGSVIERRKNSNPKSLLGKIFNEGPMQKIQAASKWGKSNGITGIKEYSKFKEEHNQGVDVCSFCGFVVNGIFPWLGTSGTSPDFLKHDKHEFSNSFGLGEVKCPYIAKET